MGYNAAMVHSLQNICHVGAKIYGRCHDTCYVSRLHVWVLRHMMCVQTCVCKNILHVCRHHSKWQSRRNEDGTATATGIL